jgi:hypothetical protein
MYSSTLPSTSALGGGWVVNATLRPLYLRERPGTHCIGGDRGGTVVKVLRYKSEGRCSIPDGVIGIFR